MTTNKPTPEQLAAWRAQRDENVDQVHAERVRTTPGPSGLPRERRGESRHVEVPLTLDDLGRRVYGHGGATGTAHLPAPANGGQVAAYGRGGEHATDNETDLSAIGARIFGF